LSEQNKRLRASPLTNSTLLRECFHSCDNSLVRLSNIFKVFHCICDLRLLVPSGRAQLCFLSRRHLLLVGVKLTAWALAGTGSWQQEPHRACGPDEQGLCCAWALSPALLLPCPEPSTQDTVPPFPSSVTKGEGSTTRQHALGTLWETANGLPPPPCGLAAAAAGPRGPAQAGARLSPWPRAAVPVSPASRTAGQVWHCTAPDTSFSAEEQGTQPPVRSREGKGGVSISRVLGPNPRADPEQPTPPHCALPQQGSGAAAETLPPGPCTDRPAGGWTQKLGTQQRLRCLQPAPLSRLPAGGETRDGRHSARLRAGGLGAVPAWQHPPPVQHRGRGWRSVPFPQCSQFTWEELSHHS